MFSNAAFIYKMLVCKLTISLFISTMRKPYIGPYSRHKRRYYFQNSPGVGGPLVIITNFSVLARHSGLVEPVAVALCLRVEDLLD
jgi:hypothetical protein